MVYVVFATRRLPVGNVMTVLVIEPISFHTMSRLTSYSPSPGASIVPAVTSKRIGDQEGFVDATVQDPCKELVDVVLVGRFLGGE